MATYYAKHNASGGGVGSFADPFTLQELLDNTGAGDVGLVCATGTYTPSATIDVDTNSGVPDSPIAIRGANSDGSDDGTVATIDGSSISSADVFLVTVTNGCIAFANLLIQNATQYGIHVTGAARHTYKNIRITGSSSDGFRQEVTTDYSAFIECEFDSNGGDGFGINSAARGKALFLRCKIHDNTTHGIHTSPPHSASYGWPFILDCLIYDNESNGVFFDGAGSTYGGAVVRGCVFFGNTDNGLEFEADAHGPLIIENNIFRSNGGYGIDFNSLNAEAIVSCDYNCYHNNSSGATDISTPGSNNITSDPKFTLETDSLEDFSLKSDSPCLAAGVDAGVW